jgi:hypothetical protein
MANADSALRWMFIQERFQAMELSLAAADIDFAIINNCDAGTVIAAVFQAS